MIMGSNERVGTIPAIVTDGKVVKRDAHTKSLGILIDEYLSWDKHIDYIPDTCIMQTSAASGFSCL